MGGLELDEASFECDDFSEEEVSVLEANLIIGLAGAEGGHGEAGDEGSAHRD